jgi:3-isopropylmalate/(R)-2-methylmalate dehydratase small subunit
MDTLFAQGLAHVYGDNINTDVIIPGKYTKTLDLQTLAEHVLEDLDPQFRVRLQPGDILVAGDNFGCGSSREQAPLALKSAGVAAVIARYFARIFFRNAINIGLPVIEADWAEYSTGDRLRLDLTSGQIDNLTTGARLQASPLPPGMIAILKTGGLAAYLKSHGDYPE